MRRSGIEEWPTMPKNKAIDWLEQTGARLYAVYCAESDTCG